MDTVTLIEQAKGLGLTLAIDGDKLTVTGPKTPAAAALVAEIAQHKPAVIELLQSAEPLDPLPPTGDLYDLFGQDLTAAELAAVRSRHPEKTIEARTSGDYVRVTAIYRAGAELWTAPSGRRYAVAQGG
mgnify:CR=1 FL=1